MANAELNVTLREEAGKGVARRLRAQGLVPAVVYGKGLEPCTVSVEPKALDRAVSSAAG
ncbi:MAG: 50S ribosomal protein L25, partial [Geopsychrobacter sp.]|nr:50S ribosomal protein L25 [Geopsychrobacter sp.]